MKFSTIRLLLFSGLLIPFIFWTSTIIAGSVHGNYNHFRDTVSELGGIGTQSEELMTIFTWICTIISLVFLVGLTIVCRQLNLNRIPLVGILGFSIMFGWAAIFHSGNPLHSKAGPALLLLVIGPLLAAILWRGKRLRKLRLFSLVSFVIMLLIIVRAIPSATIQNNYTGLIQRLVHLGWSVWFVSLSLSFLTLTTNRFVKI
jgi:hypothetical protein